jgi:dimethylhistidine N-methyltransferase
MNFTLTRLPVQAKAMKEEVLAGLKTVPKTVSPKYLYDEEGSRLFDRICTLPEYYPTRSETSILERYSGVIMNRLGHDLCIIELGAGACHKGRLLLESGRASSFVPIDISTEFLKGAALGIAHAFPHISVHAVAMDFLTPLDKLAALLPESGRRVILYAGSSIGNFEPLDAGRLLFHIHKLLRQGDVLLIGYDLKKDPCLLQCAYNDSRGVTAAFNLNLLTRFNRELEADFDVKSFRHIALYNEPLGRVEMHLESLSPQKVSIAEESISFDRHERIHTENSYKYTVAEFDELAHSAGFDPAGVWKDPAGYFAMGLYTKRQAGQSLTRCRRYS